MTADSVVDEPFLVSEWKESSEDHVGPRIPDFHFQPCVSRLLVSALFATPLTTQVPMFLDNLRVPSFGKWQICALDFAKAAANQDQQ